jgi:hypothetical protein
MCYVPSSLPPGEELLLSFVGAEWKPEVVDALYQIQPAVRIPIPRSSIQQTCVLAWIVILLISVKENNICAPNTCCYPQISPLPIIVNFIIIINIITTTISYFFQRPRFHLELQCLLVYLRTSSSCLCLPILIRLAVPSVFPSITYLRWQFLRKIWPVHFAFFVLLYAGYSSPSWLYIMLLPTYCAELNNRSLSSPGISSVLLVNV